MQMSNPDPTIERLKECAWQQIAAIAQGLRKALSDEDGWHEARAALIKPAYLTAENPYDHAGHREDAATRETSRGFITSQPADDRFDFVMIRPENAPPGRRADVVGYVIDFLDR